MAGLARRQVQRVQALCILPLATRSSGRSLRRLLPHRMAVQHYTTLMATSPMACIWCIFREGKLFPWIATVTNFLTYEHS
jgi:hypothetical protein